MEPASLPRVGQVINGFEALEIRDFPMVSASVVRFVHQKTGAQLYYIANDDINRVFDLTFRTESPDDTGIPHVFEHAVLCGSEKYPSAQLYSNLKFQTYNTYMNALKAMFPGTTVGNDHGGDPEYIPDLTWLRQVKQCTPEKLVEWAEMLKVLADEGAIRTAGSASAIKAEAERYDKILDPFGTYSIS